MPHSLTRHTCQGPAEGEADFSLLSCLLEYVMVQSSGLASNLQGTVAQDVFVFWVRDFFKVTGSTDAWETGSQVRCEGPVGFTYFLARIKKCKCSKFPNVLACPVALSATSRQRISWTIQSRKSAGKACSGCWRSLRALCVGIDSIDVSNLLYVFSSWNVP